MAIFCTEGSSSAFMPILPRLSGESAGTQSIMRPVPYTQSVGATAKPLAASFRG